MQKSRRDIINQSVKAYFNSVGFANPFFFLNKKIRGQKRIKEVDKWRNSISYIEYFILNKYCQDPVQDKQCPFWGLD